MKSLLVSLATAAALTVAAPAVAAEYTIDQAHTQAQFTIVHLAISKVHGQIPIASGTAEIGDNELPSSVNATLDVTKLDTHDAKRDSDLKGPDFFDAAKYPTITFVSTKIAGTPADFTMTGNLTLHGVTKPVTLTGKVEGRVTDGRGRHHIAYTAATTFDRREFGMNWGNFSGGALIAGYDVTIDLEVDAFTPPAK